MNINRNKPRKDLVSRFHQKAGKQLARQQLVT
uniref:Uncharacterized protein n=1 Tax=Rhizophora mucronata TaxID=61149 RepID=A0A2P2P238_RHIMU